MANYRAIKDGVWSDLTVWEDNSTGSYQASTELPWMEDNCLANGFTVSIDMDITVNLLRNQWLANHSTTWGEFVVDDNEDRTIIVLETIYGSNLTTIYPLKISENNDGNTINIVCPKTENAASAWNWVIGVEWKCTINYTGNLNSAAYLIAWMYIAVGWVTVNHTGNILPDNPDQRAYGVRIVAVDNPEIPVVYNLTWNVGYPWLWIGTWFSCESSALELNIVWTVYENISKWSISIKWTQQCNIDIKWNVSSISWGRMISIDWNNPYSSFILRDWTFSTAVHANDIINIAWAQVPATLHNMNLEMVDTFVAIKANILTITHDEPVYWKFRKYGQDYYMYSHPTGQPMPKDVRRGTLYWNNDEMEGTLIVPSKENVAIWVPVDDTVGEACFDLVGIKDRLWVINDWIKKASLLIPHTEDLPED